VLGNAASILDSAAFKENRRERCGTRRNKKNGKGYAKTDIRFWMGVLLKPKYTDADRRIEAKNWSVRIQYQVNLAAKAGRGEGDRVSCCFLSNFCKPCSLHCFCSCFLQCSNIVEKALYERECILGNRACRQSRSR
jgi:hypothetical protein